MKSTDPMLLRATFGAEEEKRRDSSYSWDSARRGDDPYVIIQWTFSGMGFLESGKKTHEVGAGKALLTIIPEKVRYYYPPQATDPWIFSWINLEGPLAIDFAVSLRETFGSVLDIPPNSPCAWAFSQLIAKAAKRSFKSSIEESELCYRFFLLCREQQEKGGKAEKSSLRELVEYYRQHGNEMVAVKEMAERAGLSREHFTRAFRKETGLGPAAYLRDFRMNRAAAMLKRTDMPVAEIAMSCGFASARQFSKTFKHFRGASPLEFRQSKGPAER